MTVNVYSIDNVLVQTFSSLTAAGAAYGVSRFTVSRYISSGKVWNKLYTFRKSTY
jgi:hypothetical protein